VKQTVGILYGGKSQEHEVSRQSAASIWRFIDHDKYNVVCIGIERDGTWHWQETAVVESHPARGEMLAIVSRTEPVAIVPGRGLSCGSRQLRVDVVFPILHGPFGEDGTVQGLLEMAGIAYAGAGVLGSALAMDKARAKIIWRAAGLPVVDWLTADRREFLEDDGYRTKVLKAAAEQFGFPLFVKPVNAGSSVGVGKVLRAEDLTTAMEAAFKFDGQVLVERAIDAREIECAVIGNEHPRVFPPGEIIPHHDYYSYEAKYLDPDGARPSIPADLNPTLSQQARDLALRAYRCLGLEGFSRVDLFLDRTSSCWYVNEINSIPGFTNISMFPRLCEAGGLTYRDLINTLIELAFDKLKRRDANSYQFTST
jgi:D-alanine-D-alanine ligase